MLIQLGKATYRFIDLFLWYLVFICISRVEFAHGSGDKVIDVSENLHLDSRNQDFSFFEDNSNEGLREHMTQLLKDPSLRDCPAPILPVSRVHCSQTLCNSDEDCPDPDFKCCFNGCVFSCQHKIPPPPVIDWQEEPKGISSIPIYPDNLRNFSDFSAPKVKICSTSPLPPPTVSLDCPANYVCRIQYIEDPLEGMPNLGVCVPVTFEESDVSDDGKTYLEKAGKETVILPGGCSLSKEKYDQLQELQKRPYIVGCLCTRGALECKISRNNLNNSGLRLKSQMKNTFQNIMFTRRRRKQTNE